MKRAVSTGRTRAAAPIGSNPIAAAYFRAAKEEADTTPADRSAGAAERAPDVAARGDLEYFLGGVDRHARPVGADAFDRAGLALAQAIDEAGRHVHPARDVVDDLVAHHRDAEIARRLSDLHDRMGANES